MPAGLRDVAERAGVSVKTVSNVVNGYEHVRPETRARVQRALDELDYRPNLSARHLRRGRGGLIAVALPDLTVPYFAELASALVDAAATRGYTVLVDQTNARRDSELLAAQGLRTPLIDGLILSALSLRSEDLRDREPGLPLVLLGEHPTTAGSDHIAIDNVAAAAEATGHLLEIGRRRVALLGVQRREASHMAALRDEGFRAAHAAAGVAVDDDLLMPTEGFQRTDGVEGMTRLLDSGSAPDAIFCLNDLLAVGAMHVLAERGLRVPEDVAVVGFDDIEEGRYQRPALTTVAPDKAQIAHLALDRLLERMAGRGDAEPREVVADHRLEVRGSTVAGRVARFPHR